MTLVDSILASWDKQAACLMNLTTLLDDRLLRCKASEDGWDVAYHLGHVHEVRLYWLKMAGGAWPPGSGELIPLVDEIEVPIYDVATIQEQLRLSERGMREFLAAKLSEPPATLGPYESAALFHQHMVWHEGYHFSLILLAMRLAGAEPSEEWDEANVWSNFRSYG